MKNWNINLLTENISNTSSGKRSSDSSNPLPKDSAWAVVCEWMTAWALAGLPAGGVTPVKASGTFGGQGATTADAIQVDWDKVCTGTIRKAVEKDNTGTRRRNTETGMDTSGSLTNKSGIEQVPATSPFTQAELDALGAAIKVETDKCMGMVDGMTANLGPNNVFVTSNDTGHTDILVLQDDGIPVAGFHNKNNAQTRGDARDIGMSSAGQSALAGSQLDGAREYLQSITAWMNDQFSNIPANKFEDVIQKIDGPAGQNSFVIQSAIKQVATKTGRMGARITRDAFVKLYNNTPAVRTNFGNYVEQRLSIVPQFRIITDCGKAAFKTWTVSSDKYDVAGFRWEDGKATASSADTKAELKIPTSEGEKTIECTIRSDDNRVIQLKLKENRSYNKYDLIAEEIASMDGGQDIPPDVADALVDELLNLIGPIPAEVVNETDVSGDEMINESRWLKLAGLLND